VASAQDWQPLQLALLSHVLPPPLELDDELLEEELLDEVVPLELDDELLELDDELLVELELLVDDELLVELLELDDELLAACPPSPPPPRSDSCVPLAQAMGSAASAPTRTTAERARNDA
jgi:hypothetical protein